MYGLCASWSTVGAHINLTTFDNSHKGYFIGLDNIIFYEISMI